MVVEASRALWTGSLSCILALAGLGFVAGSGCSSSSSGTSQAADSAGVCPATIQDTVGQACSVEGLKCGPTFPCGVTSVPIYCRCVTGVFQCVDGAGDGYDGGTPPTCTNPKPVDAGACPATENAAATSACSAAQNGLACAYPPACDGGTQAFDLCTCGPGPSGAFVFECENACGGAGGPLPEAGGTDEPEPEPEAGPPGGDAGPG